MVRQLATTVTALSLICASAAHADVVSSVDLLGPGDAGYDPLSPHAVIDVFVDASAGDKWTAGGLTGKTLNGATLRYGSALVNPGAGDAEVSFVSDPRARDAADRFSGNPAGLAGGYQPVGPAVATATAFNVAWFAVPGPSTIEDGFVARIALDLSGVSGATPASLVVAPPDAGPAGATKVFESVWGASLGTVATSLRTPAPTGVNWAVYSTEALVVPLPSSVGMAAAGLALLLLPKVARARRPRGARP